MLRLRSLLIDPRWRLLVGCVLGIGLLQVLGEQDLEGQFEDLALGLETKTVPGIVSGTTVHCHTLSDLSACLKGYAERGQHAPVVLWLGNSQLHAVNQYVAGQETAVPGLHRALSHDGKYLLALSQPNANLQEHYALLAYLLPRLPIDTVILPVVFDDFRETGLRTDLSAILSDPAAAASMGSTEIGRRLLQHASRQQPAADDWAGLASTPQEHVERELDARLGEHWPLWAQRPELRGQLVVSLFELRNWALGIDASSLRKVIPSRYAMNRDALVAALRLVQAHGAQAFVYIVPLRPDLAAPYDPTEYSRFKQEIEQLASLGGARFANLEGLVPAGLWGSQTAVTVGAGKDLDFMHFQAGGHLLLSEAIQSNLSLLWQGEAANP